MAITRLGSNGHGTRRCGSFSGRGPVSGGQEVFRNRGNIKRASSFEAYIERERKTRTDLEGI